MGYVVMENGYFLVVGVGVICVIGMVECEVVLVMVEDFLFGVMFGVDKVFDVWWFK